MEVVVLLFAVVVLFAITSSAGRKKPAARPVRAAGETFAPTQATDERKRFCPPMPAGYHLYADRVSVAGIRFRNKDAVRFAQASRHSLRFERQPSNEHDPNAIKVIGITPEGEHFLGYVWKARAAQIVEAGLYDQVRPRLISIYFQGGYVDVEYQIVGPKSEKAWFDDHSDEPPVIDRRRSSASGGR